jgi:hypothetical protein
MIDIAKIIFPIISRELQKVEYLKVYCVDQIIIFYLVGIADLN